MKEIYDFPWKNRLHETGPKLHGKQIFTPPRTKVSVKLKTGFEKQLYFCTQMKAYIEWIFRKEIAQFIMKFEGGG